MLQIVANILGAILGVPGALTAIQPPPTIKTPHKRTWRVCGVLWRGPANGVLARFGADLTGGAIRGFFTPGNEPRLCHPSHGTGRPASPPGGVNVTGSDLDTFIRRNRLAFEIGGIAL